MSESHLVTDFDKSVISKTNEDSMIQDVTPFCKVIEPNYLESLESTGKKIVDVQGVTLNTKALIFWTADQMFALPFSKLRTDDLKNLVPDFELVGKAEDDEFPYIRRVRSNNDNGDEVCITVRISDEPGMTKVIAWNVFGENKETGELKSNNFEVSSVVVKDPFFVAFGEKGDMVVVHLEHQIDDDGEPLHHKQ